MGIMALDTFLTMKTLSIIFAQVQIVQCSYFTIDNIDKVKINWLCIHLTNVIAWIP